MNASTGAGAADWWHGALIYEIYIRSFQDSDGDGIGDLAGATRRLAHVADLGVDAVWISPFFVSPMKDFGYDVADYTDVDPRFGTLADFDALVVEAHRLGLKVIIDQVLSHSSDKHPWFKESRSSRDNAKADWYVWADAKPDGSPPNNWLSVFGGPAWQWDTRRCQYYLHNFLAEQPDLNFYCPEVQDALLDSMGFWLKRGVDGFRLDAVNFYFHDRSLADNPPAVIHETNFAPAVNPYDYQAHIHDKNRPENLEFLRRLRAYLDRYPGAMAVGEVGDSARSLEIMAAYTSGRDKLQMCYTFDFLGPEFSAHLFRDRCEKFERVVGDGWGCWAFSNHDVVRHASRWAGHVPEEKLPALAAAILLSLRGSACLYEGEELGLTEANIRFEDLVDPYGIAFWPEFKGRDGCRTPMVWEADAVNAGFSPAKPWLPIPAEHIPHSADRERGDPRSSLSRYRQIIAFRRAHPVLRRGDIAFHDVPEPVLAFTRGDAGERVLCVFNCGNAVAAFPLPKGYSVTPLEGHGFAGRLTAGTVNLPAGEAFFGRVA